MIAALFVETDGVYFGLPNVDPWDEARDARRYAGPYPVVAHPPCERWGRYWHGGPSAKVRRVKGDDNGCFAAALEAVRRWGGVLEHPAASHAWAAYKLPRPLSEGWQRDIDGGWCCQIEQGWFGHRARKATWLYAHGVDPPSAPWGKAPGKFIRLDDGCHHRELGVGVGLERISARECRETPIAFRDFLLAVADSTILAQSCANTCEAFYTV